MDYLERSLWGRFVRSSFMPSVPRFPRFKTHPRMVKPILPVFRPIGAPKGVNLRRFLTGQGATLNPQPGAKRPPGPKRIPQKRGRPPLRAGAPQFQGSGTFQPKIGRR